MKPFIPRIGLFSRFLTLMLFGSIFVGSATAQDTTSARKWRFLAEPYIMFPYMDGETGIGNNLVLPVEADPGDIFSKLKMAGMLYFEAKTDKWAISTDLVYMNLQQDVKPGILIYSATVGAKQFIWGASGLYRLLPFLELGAGGRINYLQTSSEGRINVLPAGTQEFSGRHSKTWFDPVIIARLSTDINDKWLFQFVGDVGGFGVGSDLTWQLQGYVGYSFTKLFQLTAGYRVLSVDYYAGEAPKDFIFDVNEFGPVIRFGFNF
ncbi:MAG: hypothetical protein Q8T08_00625 [Ignavibacteria bacterium]|nr:hypothetical protein [Ignavibacteria bacterium]